MKNCIFFFPLSQIGQGTYSNVYKARDSLSGKIVALKKVRFDNLEPESGRALRGCPRPLPSP